MPPGARNWYARPRRYMPVEASCRIPVVVGRADIDGVHGPRFAVASGLVHLYAAEPARHVAP